MLLRYLLPKLSTNFSAPIRQFHASMICQFKKEKEGGSDEKEPPQQPLPPTDTPTTESKSTPPQKEALAQMPFATNVAPTKLGRNKFKREDFWFISKKGDKLEELAQEEQEGMVGASSFLSVSNEQLDRFLPTLATMGKLFDGTPYNQLPTVYVRAGYTNTIVGCVDAKGNTIMVTSSGKEGFKGAKKKSTLTGHATGAAAAQKIIRRGIQTVRVIVKGIGPGRITAVKALALAGINVVSITDKTPLPELGPRPRKIRRV